MEFYLHFSLLMARSLGFGSNTTNLIALLRLAFASAANLKFLTLLVTFTRRTILQKVPYHTLMCSMCLQAQGFRFFFTPRQGFFSPFLHSTIHYRSLVSIQAWRVVPPYSHRVSRVRRYSGYSQRISFFAYVTLTLFRWPSHAILLNLILHDAVQTPKVLLLLVWPLPRSLATTSGISVDFFSSPYLDVSVQEVPYSMLFYSQGVDRVLLCRVSPFGNPRIIACFRLPVAFRRSLRPSSATNAKASPLRPFQLDLFRIMCPNVC